MRIAIAMSSPSWASASKREALKRFSRDREVVQTAAKMDTAVRAYLSNLPEGEQRNASTSLYGLQALKGNMPLSATSLDQSKNRLSGPLVQVSASAFHSPLLRGVFPVPSHKFPK